MSGICKKCLLLEAGERAALKSVKDYLELLSHEEKVSESIYNDRLEKCRNCDFLISGMCRKCGCYVEIRAALKNKECPNADNILW